jgi:alginate O-acetyltransferase complex protein AlgI
MSICSFDWVICFLLASLVFPLFRSGLSRQCFLATCNVAFLVTLVPDVLGWITLCIFLTFGYLVAKMLEMDPRRWILITYLVVLIFAFLVIKQYAFVQALLPSMLFQRTIAVVGLSYFLFRQIQVAVDAYQGQITGLSMWNYLNFQINLFGLLAGPIQRYQQFLTSWLQLTPVLNGPDAILKAYLRVFIGVIKITIIAAAFLVIHEYCSAALQSSIHSGVQTHRKDVIMFLGMFYSFPAYIYFNFSGYCDIVIAGAAFFGIEMPENFNKPYLSRNMIDYWTRWHRTLGLWVRDYIFTPMYMAIAAKWPRKASSLAFLCYFVALLLTGIWHGSTWNFVFFGILNGVGVAAAKLWENLLLSRLGRRGLKDYLDSARIRHFAIFANFNFVCITILFFPSDLHGTLAIIRHVFT